MSTFTRPVALLVAGSLVAIFAAFVAADLIVAMPDRGIGRVVGLPAEGTFEAVGAAARLRSSGKRVYPLAPDAFPDGGLTTVDGKRLNVLGGASLVPTVLCNETGTNLIIESDKYGFSNPPEVWERKSWDMALIGDSFTHGQCVGPTKDIASNFPDRAAVMNMGISGSGPLTQLGVLREYVVSRKPKAVVWFFYEGNDMEDLAREKTQGLASYLKPDFSQNLEGRSYEIDSAVRKMLDSVIATTPIGAKPISPVDVLLLRHLRGVLEMHFRSLPATPRADFAMLDSVFALARSSTRKWNPVFVLVYLPERRRFAPSAPANFGHDHKPDSIRAGVLAIADRRKIPVVDMALAFSRQPQPLRFWTGVRSHYTEAGYKLVADSVKAALLRHSIMNDSK